MSRIFTIPIGLSFLFASGVMSAAQLEPEVTTGLDKPLKLGRSEQGYAMRLDLLQLSGPELVEYYLVLKSRGPDDLSEHGAKWLFMKRVELVLGGEVSIELDTIPGQGRRERQAMMSGRLLDHSETEKRGMIPIESPVEEVPFPISADQLLLLARARDVELVAIGRTGRRSEHRIKTKDLERLEEWIERHVRASQ